MKEIIIKKTFSIKNCFNCPLRTLNEEWYDTCGHPDALRGFRTSDEKLPEECPIIKTGEFYERDRRSTRTYQEGTYEIKIEEGGEK